MEPYAERIVYFLAGLFVSFLHWRMVHTGVRLPPIKVSYGSEEHLGIFAANYLSLIVAIMSIIGAALFGLIHGRFWMPFVFVLSILAAQVIERWLGHREIQTLRSS